ncbi:hypothetical protein QFZ37_003399 [Chryseobacterium ginsenosidimutans]|nr:hypothetical protein [Chryseobacterium ginsenosidimutans]
MTKLSGCFDSDDKNFDQTIAVALLFYKYMLNK